MDEKKLKIGAFVLWKDYDIDKWGMPRTVWKPGVICSAKITAWGNEFWLISDPDSLRTSYRRIGELKI